jgi:hypothetical protein
VTRQKSTSIRMIECLAVAAGRIGSGFFMLMRNRILPGRYITDCQMRLHMSLRQAETPTVAAAKAGFSAAAYRIEQNPRLPSKASTARARRWDPLAAITDHHRLFLPTLLSVRGETASTDVPSLTLPRRGSGRGGARGLYACLNDDARRRTRGRLLRPLRCSRHDWDGDNPKAAG